MLVMVVMLVMYVAHVAAFIMLRKVKGHLGWLYDYDITWTWFSTWGYMVVNLKLHGCQVWYENAEFCGRGQGQRRSTLATVIRVFCMEQVALGGNNRKIVAAGQSARPRWDATGMRFELLLLTILCCLDNSKRTSSQALKLGKSETMTFNLLSCVECRVTSIGKNIPPPICWQR